jgi:uncharacterized membrane protein YdbT with pleckstrin-like domain
MTLQTSAAGSDGEEVLFEGRPAVLPDLGQLLLCVLTVGLWLIPLYLRSLGTHYRVTTRRVVVETGVLSKRLEQVDLYRISDYAVDRPFMQRLLGTGNLMLTTLDKSSPEIGLRGLKTDVVALYERLRVATEAEKQRRAVRVVDYE